MKGNIGFDRKTLHDWNWIIKSVTKNLCGKVDMTNMCMEVRVKLITNGIFQGGVQKKKVDYNREIGEMPTKETKEGKIIKLKTSRTFFL